MDFGLILPRMSAYDADTLSSLVAEQGERVESDPTHNGSHPHDALRLALASQSA